jgi:hypothetical protein
MSASERSQLELGGAIGQFDISLIPLHTVPALPSLRRIEFFAAEFIHEFSRVGFFLEAEHVPPLTTMSDRMLARTERDRSRQKLWTTR